MGVKTPSKVYMEKKECCSYDYTRFVTVGDKHGVGMRGKISGEKQPEAIPKGCKVTEVKEAYEKKY